MNDRVLREQLRDGLDYKDGSINPLFIAEDFDVVPKVRLTRTIAISPFVPAAVYPILMPDDRNALTPATAEDAADGLAFALRFDGRKRVHNADEIMSEIVAKRLVEHLERAGFVVMKRPPIGDGAALGRGLRADTAAPFNAWQNQTLDTRLVGHFRGIRGARRRRSGRQQCAK